MADDRIDLVALLASRPSRPTGAKVVGIDGHGGSGKSSLADLLGLHLGAEIVHTDDFAGPDNPRDWWALVLEHVLEPIAAGRATLSYPRSQWWRCARPAVVDQPVTDVMILEGVGSLRTEFRHHLSFGVFVDAPREVCIDRGVARDAAMGTPAEVRAQWDEWFDAELEYIDQHHPEHFANVIIDGTRPVDTQIELG